MFVKISDYVDQWQWPHLAQFMEVNSVLRIRTCLKINKRLVRAKLRFEGFDNATQPQKPHWDSVRPVFAFPYEFVSRLCHNK